MNLIARNLGASLALALALGACTEAGQPLAEAAPAPVAVFSADVLAKIDEYQVLAGQVSTDLAADGTSDHAQPKLERLMVLAEDITPAFIARHPNCKAYLEASLRIRGQWATLDPDAIERDYHDDEALPKEGTSPACYHMKDLIVHPATAAALLSAESPELAKAKREIDEVLAHVGVVRGG